MAIKILILLLMKAGMTSPCYSDDCWAVSGGWKARNAYFYPFPGTATQTEPLVCVEHPWGRAKSGVKPHGGLGLAQPATTMGRIHQFHSCSYLGPLGIYSGIQIGRSEVRSNC